jgi:glycine/D-amino acid oxidase-like deaminating enzyme
MIDLAVIGGGLFGQIVAAHARTQRAKVLVVSDQRAGAGSPAAGCVMRPSWMSKMSREQIDAAFSLLDELYGLRPISFTIQPLGKTVECFRVEPTAVLGGAAQRGTCQAIDQHGVVVLDTGETIEARAVVVAAGIWTAELCPWVPEVTGRWGWSHRGRAVDKPTIKAWAPYRQIVAFNMSDGAAWVGDGSAFVQKSVNETNARRSSTRCATMTKLHTTTLGARPYCDVGGAPCHVSRRGRVWAVTGGAKNGTAAAAWAAREIVREALV